MKKKFFVLFLGLLLSLASSPALAYLCWNEPDAIEKSMAADLIFTGEAVQIDKMEKSDKELGTERTSVLFSVDKVWKGLNKDSDSYVTADTEALYEYDFKIGGNYLVYGYKIYNGRISMVGCPRIKLISEAKEDMELLGKPLFSFSGKKN